MTIALLGAGRIGSAFGRALLAGGSDLVAWSGTRSDVDALVELGVTCASSAVEAVDRAEVVLVVLDPSEVRDVLEVLDPAGRTVVNYSGGTTAEAVAIRDLVVAGGGRYIDAIVSTRRAGAGADEVEDDPTVYYAGDHEAYGLLASPLDLLPGRKCFVGLPVGNARALEAAWVGGFESSAADAFRAAAAIAVEEGVALAAVVDSIDHHLARLRALLLESVEATA